METMYSRVLSLSLVSAYLLVQCASYVQHVQGFGNNVSVLCFLIPFAFGLIHSFAGITSALALLCIAPAFLDQSQSIYNLGVVSFPGLAFDISTGFSLAFMIRSRGFSKIGASTKAQKRVLAALAWISLSAALAIARNIWQSGSTFSAKGFLFNLAIARDLSWHDDYFPLKDLLSYLSAAVMTLCVAYLAQKNRERTFQSIVNGLFIGALANFAFSVMQKIFGIGWARNGMNLGLNGFWPDLHAFAGFMTLVFFFGLWLAKSEQSRGNRIRSLVFIGVGILCIYWSGSRFTLFLTAGITSVWLILQAISRRSHRAVGLGSLTAVIAAIIVVSIRGYRGISFADLSDLLMNFSFDRFNLMFSYRPEIFISAAKMYQQFPLLGLGQGAFNHLSSIPNFSTSNFLLISGGENAHNYFLQTFAELGPIGFILLSWVILSSLRPLQHPLQKLCGYAYTGIFVANLFAHSLLVREMLLILALFVGLAYGVQSAEQPAPPKRFPRGILLAAFALYVIAALYEYRASFNQFPFVYGQRCYSQQGLFADGWTSGSYITPLPKPSHALAIKLNPGHPDVGRRPLDVWLTLQSADGRELETRSFTFDKEEELDILWDLPPENQDFLLTLKTSRCFVPLNLGLGYDPRHLGVRLAIARLPK